VVAMGCAVPPTVEKNCTEGTMGAVFGLLTGLPKPLGGMPLGGKPPDWEGGGPPGRIICGGGIAVLMPERWLWYLLLLLLLLHGRSHVDRGTLRRCISSTKTTRLVRSRRLKRLLRLRLLGWI